MSETPEQRTCPSEIELDAVRTGEAGPELRAHVAACEACTAALRLHEALGAELGLAEALVPRELDEALRVDRRREADRVARRLRRRRVALVALPAAAGLLLVVAGLQLLPTASRPGRAPAPASAALEAAPVEGDYTGDGRLDVLDAFALARTLEAGESPSLEWDRDGDGLVTKSDVDALAAAAVSLS